jgi:hypothetical protein
MRGLKLLAATAITAGCLTALLPTAEAQVAISIGVAPECPYGYYDESPYGCAPAGYYGPEWFNGGIFVGAGPWFRGASGFRGHVNNSFHPQHGYKGAFPNRGEKAEPSRRVSAGRFKGNEERDGRGHVTGDRH